MYLCVAVRWIRCICALQRGGYDVYVICVAVRWIRCIYYVCSSKVDTINMCVAARWIRCICTLQRGGYDVYVRCSEVETMYILCVLQ